MTEPKTPKTPAKKASKPAKEKPSDDTLHAAKKAAPAAAKAPKAAKAPAEPKPRKKAEPAAHEAAKPAETTGAKGMKSPPVPEAVRPPETDPAKAAKPPKKAAEHKPAPAVPAAAAPAVPAPVKKPAKPKAPEAPAAPAASAPRPAAVPETPKPAAPPAPVAPPRPAAPPPPPPPPAPRGKIKINELVTVKDLAEKMNVKVPDVIKKLLSLGKVVHINQRLDSNTAEIVADAFNFDVEKIALYGEEALGGPAEDESLLQPRSPVVTVMGHVDHGKTSLLDAIRETRVAEGEAGGITQHIGAYRVVTEKGAITFLDTPGHEAFTAMRARGAKATDLVILVVGADDGVMPQTIEAIDHAKAADVPLVVAINKCDLPTANPQKIRQELSQHGLLSEEWGGKTVMVEVSARQKTNIDKLLEMVLLEAELLELKANPNRAAQAVVVEAKLDPRRGPVATVLVQKGTLRVGDAFVCGQTAGKVRALVDHTGQRIKEAGPSWPAEILGLAGTPQAGDRLVVLGSEREAREIAERRQNIADSEQKSQRQHLTLEALHDQVAAGKVKSLPIVLKADVQGSLEPIRDSLEKLSTSEIGVRIIHSGTGGINNSDIILAAASDAVILGFNVRPDPASEDLARHEGVEIKTYRIIYELINDVKAALEGLLDPEEKDVTVGWAEVRQVIRAPKVGAVAGCYVTDGKLVRTGKARLVRNGAIVFDGSLGSLRRFKDDVREVEKGFECGLTLDGYQDVKQGDRVEVYVLEKRARKLSSGG
jgi:translation initiation factor IF-2